MTQSSLAPQHGEAPGFTPETLAVRDELGALGNPLSKLSLGPLRIEAHKGRDTLWLIVRREGQGGVALRTVRAAGELSFAPAKRGKNKITWPVETPSGSFSVTLQTLGETMMRVTVKLKPHADLLIAFWPRDIYPLDTHDDPTHVQGRVEAAQRGLNTGLCYFCLDKPAFGSVLYVQNLTALNPFLPPPKPNQMAWLAANGLNLAISRQPRL